MSERGIIYAKGRRVEDVVGCGWVGSETTAVFVTTFARCLPFPAFLNCVSFIHRLHDGILGKESTS